MPSRGEVVKGRLASRRSVSPRQRAMRGIFLCVLYVVAFHNEFLRSRVEPNLVVFLCVCLASPQSTRELALTMTLSLCLWPRQVAGFPPVVLFCFT